MQQLDAAIMGPFKTYYAQEFEKWIRSNLDVLSPLPHQRALRQSLGYMKATTAEAAANGFPAIGPYDFAVLNKPDETGEVSSHHADRQPQPGTSRDIGPTAATEIIRPTDISLVPTTETLITARKFRSGSAQFISSYPQGQIKSLRGPRALKNVVGCELDALLFM
jgi:hypothetical protein